MICNVAVFGAANVIGSFTMGRVADKFGSWVRVSLSLPLSP